MLASVDDGGQGFTVFLRNSAVVAVSVVVITLVVSIPARTPWPGWSFVGREQISTLFLAVYLFPSIVLAVPLFIGFAKVGSPARCSA